MNRRTFLVGGAGLAVVGGATAYGLRPDDTEAAGAGPATPVVPATATATVARGDLATVREFRATISFGDSWTLETAAQGVVTASHPKGTVVDTGDEIVRVADRPVTLAIGPMPMFRTLEKIDTRRRDENNRRLTLLEGADVLQLQTFLVGAGFDVDGTLEVDGVFGARSETAVEAWQEAQGLPITGRVDTGQLIFAPHPLRLDRELRVGAPISPIEVTRADPSVMVDTSNRDRSVLTPGTDVTVVLTGGQRLAGRSEKQERTTGADGSTTWRTTITPDGTLPDESSATVEVRDVVAHDATLVPASALLALAEGGFAVEVVGEDATTTLVSVELVDALEGQAAVVGDVSPGDAVVVPT